MLRFMYGADTKELLQCCSNLSPGLRDQLEQDHPTVVTSYFPKGIQARLTKYGPHCKHVCPKHTVPTADDSRIASELCWAMVKLYSIADTYEMLDLKKLIMQRLIGMTNIAWSRRDILSVFDDIMGAVPESDGLYVTMLQDIERRLLTLMAQPMFEHWLVQRKDLEAVLGRFALKRMNLLLYYDMKDLRYCSYGDHTTETYCRLQVHSTGTGQKRKCPKCQHGQ
jgi:hypothetical protein